MTAAVDATPNDGRDRAFKALAEPARRHILALLRERPRTTGELCEAFDDLTRFGVMNHIGVLKDAGLVRTEKRGRERINSLGAEPLRELYETWMRQYEVIWAGRLGRLKREAERRERMRETMDTDWVGAPLASLHIRRSVDIEAPRDTVFKALTDDISAWWGAPYLASGEDAADIVLEPWPGGLFKEVTADGDGYVWCIVEQVFRNRLLTLAGRMGMWEAITGNIRFELEDQDGGTRLTVEHAAIGRLTAETEAGFSEGWQDLLGNRLKGFVERGERPGLRGASN